MHMHIIMKRILIVNQARAQRQNLIPTYGAERPLRFVLSDSRGGMVRRVVQQGLGEGAEFPVALFGVVDFLGELHRSFPFR